MATVNRRMPPSSQAPPPMSQRALIGDVADEVDIVRAIVAEFFGTMFLIFLGLGGVYGSAVATFDVVKTERLMMMCLSYGMAYGASVYGFSFPSSDARVLPNTRHLNPAITFSLYIAKKITFVHGLLYVVAQMVGCGVGVLLIFSLTPLDKQDVVSAYPSVENTTQQQEWVMEIITSFIMVLTVLFTNFGHLSTHAQRTAAIIINAGEESPQTHHEINCLISGFIVVVCNVLGSGVSGGYMNPLFALGITILSATTKTSAYVAPFLGAAIAVLVGITFGFNVPFATHRIAESRYQRLPAQ